MHFSVLILSFIALFSLGRSIRSVVRGATKLSMSKYTGTFDLQQTMMRIKDPCLSVPFYVDNFGFKLIHEYDFPEWKFKLFFLAIMPDGMSSPDDPRSKASEEFLWNMPRGISTLELTWNYGSDKDDNFKVSSGNVEPDRGFGHIAVMTLDVYKASEELEAAGVKFHKKPDEGRMKGLAFALDPDGYWIEIVKRKATSVVKSKYHLAQTMMRVKDIDKSLRFYRDLLGMNLLRKTDFGPDQGSFSLLFLSNAKEGTSDGDNYEQVIELTHNHGTESDADFKYYNGNDQDEGHTRGFGHIGFLCDDLDAACAYLESEGCTFKKKPNEGAMKGLAFVYDPDGYWIELIQRGLKSEPQCAPLN